MLAAFDEGRRLGGPWFIGHDASPEAQEVVSKLVLWARAVVRLAQRSTLTPGQFVGDRDVLVQAFEGRADTADRFIEAIRVDR